MSYLPDLCPIALDQATTWPQSGVTTLAQLKRAATIRGQRRVKVIRMPKVIITALIHQSHYTISLCMKRKVCHPTSLQIELTMDHQATNHSHPPETTRYPH